MQSGFRWTCHDSFVALGPIRDEWDALVLQLDGDLFASFDWCSTWWKHFGKRRHARIFVAWNDEHIVGVAPMFRETLRWGPIALRVMRPMGSDHAGTRSFWCVEPCFTPQLAKVLYDDLCESKCDLLFIGELPGYFERGKELADAFGEIAGRKNVNYAADYYPHSVFDFHGSLDEYLAGLSANERSNIRKSYRRLSEAGLGVESVCSGELDCAFDDFVEQHDAQWAHEGRLGYFRDWPGCKAFHREIARLRSQHSGLMFLRLGDDCGTVGYHYAHAFGRRIHWFQASRDGDARWDPLGPGRLLHCELVRQGIERGAKQIDGLSGYYDFKRRWGGRYIGLQSITVLSPRFTARLRARAVRGITLLASLLYFRMWFWRAAPWMRVRMPHFSRYFPGERGLAVEYIRSRFIVSALGASGDPAAWEPSADAGESPSSKT